MEIDNINVDKNAIYNLYFHNCDTVAEKIISLIDPLFGTCQDGMLDTTPNNSYYVRMILLQNSWENIEIGENDFFEKAISEPGLYYKHFVAKIIMENYLRNFSNDLLETLGIKGESTCTLD